MGLDQFAYRTQEAIKASVDFPAGFEDQELIAQWRKHPNLHGWMHALYEAKGGQSSYFNRDNLKLTLEDLEHLEKVVVTQELPVTTGFFFSESRPEEYEKDLDFIEKARDSIKQGYCVFYTSWH